MYGILNCIKRIEPFGSEQNEFRKSKWNVDQIIARTNTEVKVKRKSGWVAFINLDTAHQGKLDSSLRSPDHMVYMEDFLNGVMSFYNESPSFCKWWYRNSLE